MSFSVQQFIEKSENKDKDIRHMALFDLHNELQKETFKLDESSQRQIAEVVLKLLDDNSTDVQGQAVKCLAPLVKKMSKVQIENSIAKLSVNNLKEEEDKRDIAKLALKTVIGKIPVDVAQGPVQKSVETLIKGVDQTDKPELQVDAMESIAEILSRFGNIVTSYHEKLQQSFVRELTSKRQPVRKRAINCLSVLSTTSNDKLFNTLIEGIIKGIETAKGDSLKTYLQAVSSISKTAGQRLGKYLDKLVALLGKVVEDVSEDETEVEIRETIMQAYEAFVLRCPEEAKQHVDIFLIHAKEFIEFDPNYSYEESDEEAEEPEEEEAQEEDDEEQGGDEEDDDDVTWKVRTAAVKVMDAIIRTRPESLNFAYSELCSEEEKTIIDKFKERTETVKSDIFSLFINLLDHSVTTTTTASGEQIITPLPELKFVKATKALIVKKLKKQLATKSSKTRLGVFKVLRKLVTVLQGGLDEQFGLLVAPTVAALSEKGEQNYALKLEALAFFRLALKYHKPEVSKKYYPALSKAIFERVNDKYYKVTAEALRATAELVKTLASLKAESNFQKLVDDAYKIVFDKLNIQDIDQDVKESAITTMGVLLSTLGDNLKGNLKQVLPVLLDRLRNEITRLTACKALAGIAEAKVDISVILADTVEELALYLRKFSRPLRQSALVTLRTVVRSYGASINAKQYTTVVTELTKLVSDQDLHLAHLALELSVQALESNPKSAADIKDQVLPKVIELLGSATLQGSALESSVKLLQKLVPSVGFDNLFKSLLQRVQSTQGISKQVFTNVGKSVAALCAVASEKDTNNTIAIFTKDLKSENDSLKMLALFALGEIGRKTDLSANKQLQQDIQAFFDAGSEEIKNAASYALGNISVGNLEKFVPTILGDIKSNNKRKYLLIHSLKEVISQAQGEKLKPFIQDAVALLFENSDNEEEGIRNVVSECLGKLALVDYATVMPKLKSLLGESELKRSAVISAVKFTITDQPRDIDAKLKNDIQDFLKLLNKNESVNVRRAAVLLLNSAAHNKPSLIRDNLDRHLQNLYAELVYDKSLVKTIKLGPFNHKVDQGLELRKSAFETLETVLDVFKDRLDISKFLQQVPLGLADPNPDIKTLCHLMTTKVVALFAEELTPFIDAFLAPLDESIKKKPKENLVQQEKERHDDLLKSSLKALVHFAKVKGVEDNPVYQELVNKTIPTDPNLKNLHKAVVESEEGDVVMGEAKQ